MNALRAVVADDEPDMCEYYRKVLTRLGCEVVGEASSGRGLIQACRDCQPDLIMTDARMEDMDGITATRQIVRERPAFVIVVSAYAEWKNAGGEAAHVQIHLTKPVKQTDVAAALERARLERARQD